MSQSAEYKAITCSWRKARENARWHSHSGRDWCWFWKSDASFAGQSQSEAMQNQTKHNRLKTALIYFYFVISNRLAKARELSERVHHHQG